MPSAPEACPVRLIPARHPAHTDHKSLNDFTSANRLVTSASRIAMERLILIRFQNEPNSGRVSAWQDHAGLIHSLLSGRN